MIKEHGRNKIFALRMVPLGVLLGMLAASSVGAQTQPDAKIALHAKPHAVKAVTICTTESPNATGIPCSEYNTGPWPIETSADVYLVVTDADSILGIAGLSCGIAYGGTPVNGLAVFNWYLCADLEFPNAGPNGTWPASGGGNRITWAPSTNCQRTVIGNDGVHAVAGALYVYAYGDDVLEITRNLNVAVPELRVADCAATETELFEQSVGKVGFGTLTGVNPCGWPTNWYVDGTNTSGPWTGSPTYPFQYVADAYAAAADSDTIIVRAGDYPENLTLSKQVRIESEGGIARIGTP